MKRWLDDRGMRSLVHIERDGNSAHLWLGPFGVHLWRHKSRRVPWYRQRIELERL